MRPGCVILEQGINRRVTVKMPPRTQRPGRPSQEDTWLSSCLEAKWIKRFRRTILNKNKTGHIGASHALTNPRIRGCLGNRFTRPAPTVGPYFFGTTLKSMNFVASRMLLNSYLSTAS